MREARLASSAARDRLQSRETKRGEVNLASGTSDFAILVTTNHFSDRKQTLCAPVPRAPPYPGPLPHSVAEREVKLHACSYSELAPNAAANPYRSFSEIHFWRSL